MYKEIMKKKMNKKGFTLIELIVVIAILAILAAVLLPKFLNFKDDAQKNAVLSEAKGIVTVIEAEYAKDSTYPTSKSDIETLMGKTLDGVFNISSPFTGFTYTKNGVTVAYSVSTGQVTIATPTPTSSPTP